MKNKWIFLIFVISLSMFLCGCCELNSGGTLVTSMGNTTNSERSTTTSNSVLGWMGLTTTVVYEGTVVEMHFRKLEEDIIRFEDDYILLTQHAESYDWKLGKLH